MLPQLDPDSSRTMAAEASSRSPGRDLPEDLEAITNIFKIKVSRSDPQIKIRHRCCKAIFKACKEDKSEGWTKIQQVKQYLANLRDKDGQFIVNIVKHANPNAGIRLEGIIASVASSASSNNSHSVTTQTQQTTSLFTIDQAIASPAEVEFFSKLNTFISIYFDILGTTSQHLQDCKKAFGTLFASGLSAHFKLSSAISISSLIMLWNKGMQYDDSLLKTIGIILYDPAKHGDAAISRNVASIKAELLASHPEVFRFTITHQGLSGLVLRPDASKHVPYQSIANLAQVLGIEHVTINDYDSTKSLSLTNLALALKSITTLVSLECSPGLLTHSTGVLDLFVHLSHKITTLTFQATSGLEEVFNILKRDFNLTSLRVSLSAEVSATEGLAYITQALAKSRDLIELDVRIESAATQGLPTANPDLFSDFTSQICSLIHLRNLSLSSIPINPYKMFKHHLETLRSLTSLKLDYCYISEEDAIEFFKLLKSNRTNSLKSLYFTSHIIGNESAKALAEAVVALPCIELLDLSLNLIEDEGATAIVKTLLFPSHRIQINFEGNKLRKHIHWQIVEVDREKVYNKSIIDGKKVPIPLEEILTPSEEISLGLSGLGSNIVRLASNITRVIIPTQNVQRTVPAEPAPASPAPTKITSSKIPPVIVSKPDSPAVVKAYPNKPLPPVPAHSSPKQKTSAADNLKEDQGLEQPRITRTSSPGTQPASQSSSPETRIRSLSHSNIPSSIPSQPQISPMAASPSSQPSNELSLIDPLKTLEKAVEKNLQNLAQPSAEQKTIVQILQDMQTERALPNAHETSPEQLQVHAQVIQQDLKRDVNAQNVQIVTIENSYASINAQLAAIETKLSHKCEKNEYERLVQEHKDLKKKADDIKAQVEILMNERDIKEQRRKTIKRFQADPNLLLCYRTVQVKLEELFISFKAVAGGFVSVAEGDLAIYHTLLSVLGNVSAIVPIVGHAARNILNIAGTIVGRVDRNRQVNAAHNASELLTLSELKKFAESVARQLTENYSEQLQLLATPDQEQLFQNDIERGVREAQRMINRSIFCPSAKLFAAFGVVWIVQELCNVHANKLKTDDLDRRLIAAICQKKPPDTIHYFWQEITTRLHLDGVIDKKGQRHHPEELYTLSGIKTVKGEYFSGSEQKPNVYGWRLGTAEDANILGFRTVPVPANRRAQQIQAQLLEQHHQQLQQQAQQLETLQKTGEVVVGARVNVALQQIDEVKRELAVLKEMMAKILDEQKSEGSSSS